MTYSLDNLRNDIYKLPMAHQLTNDDTETTLTVYLNRYNRFGQLLYTNVRQSINLATGEITTLDRIGNTTEGKHNAFETYQAIRIAVDKYMEANS